MEVTELLLWIARLGVLALMYFFILLLIVAMRADARATIISGERKPVQPRASVATPASKPSSPAISQIIVTDGTAPTTGRVYPLIGALEIGRGSSCSVVIPNKFVSTNHARIFPQQDQWVLDDLGSTNGTFLNGAPVSSPQSLKAGDHIQIGDTYFEVK